MKKIASFALLAGIFSVNVCHADYCEPGAARIIGGSGNTVSFECPPPMVTCYSHTGPSSKPTNGDRITLTIGTNEYEGTLVIDTPAGPSSGEGGQGGTIVLSNGVTFEQVMQEVGGN